MQATPRELVKQHPNFGDGIGAVVSAVIWQAFRDCYSSSAYVRLEAARWLLDAGLYYWRMLDLTDESYAAALDKLMPPRLRYITAEEVRVATDNLIRTFTNYRDTIDDNDKNILASGQRSRNGSRKKRNAIDSNDKNPLASYLYASDRNLDDAASETDHSLLVGEYEDIFAIWNERIYSK